MKRLVTILSDLIPLALTVIFIVAIVMTLSHASRDPVRALIKETPKTEVACPSATTVQAAQSENVNEAARSGELDRYINSQYP
jgi:hypothetical protein